MSDLYILLPVHNRKEITRAFVTCLARQSDQHFTLVLLDDGSSDHTAEMVMDLVPTTVVLRGTGNWWWGGALQKGLDWVASRSPNGDDIVLTINDDVLIDDDFLALGKQNLDRKPGAFVQACIRDMRSREILDTGMHYDDRTFTFLPAVEPSSVNCLTTNGLFMRWHDIEIVGGFRPKLLPHYLSDYEFTIRAGRRGVRLLVSEEVVLYWDKETTGLHSFKNITRSAFLKDFFSNRSAVNPLHWISFVLLTSNTWNMPVNLWRVIRRSLVLILKKILLRN